IEGLFAVGENSCMSVHGANRLGGNSLLETLVFGKVVGQEVAKYITSAKKPDTSFVEQQTFEMRERLQALLLNEGGDSPANIRETLGQTMDVLVGVYRKSDGLEAALKMIRELKTRFKNVSVGRSDDKFNYALIRTLELENMLDLAEVIAMGALMRRESRGAHWRLDYPKRDDENFLKHSLFTQTDDYIKTEFIDVKLGMFEVKERTY
ncbi:MAG: FAD-binding protein, partial [Candidatus Thorarchaeota archaeon]|nr:FAD-binding protein [Candidatus Thorarchaeota archaeon]